ncbi:filament integrity protein FraC [Baaleninema sp.]|uniref:filament integrity protein FraC n=1 Tax=Baaleninema sp. TaxID=3101197 RepID=UPI003D01E61B
MILPLRAIACQILFIFLTIAIESTVIHRQLKITKRTSTYYAVSINLICVVIGWVIFFYIFQNLNPANLFKVQTISFIFTGRLIVDFGRDGIEPILVLSLVSVFFVSLFVKCQSLYILQRFKLLPVENLSLYEDVEHTRSERLIRYRVKADQNHAITIGHAISHAIILLILVFMVFLF